MNRNTEAAIRHMRGKRQQIVQRKRRRQLMAGAGALALALSAAVGVAGLTGTDLVDAAATRARSIMDLMDQRSPGARTTAELTKTKARHAVLPEREAAAPENLAHILAPVPAILPVDLGPPAIPELTLLSAPLPPVFFAPPPGGGGGVTACCGGGGGGGSGGGGTDSPPEVPHVPPAVPEPGTWMTMLLGFGLMGWLLRRQRTPVPVRARVRA